MWFEFQNAGIIPPAAQFKERLLERIRRIETAPERPKLIPFIESIIEEKVRTNAPKGSIQVYRSLVRQIEAYQKARRKSITFEGLTAAFMADFTAFLVSSPLESTNQVGYSDSYIHKTLTTLKMFARLADKRGYYENAPILKASLGIRKREKDTVYLNEREIEHLFELDLADRLSKVRDAFLIGCLTGLRYSDYSTIKPENFRAIEHNGKEVKCLVITTQKTKQQVILPVVNPMLIELLDRNGWKAPGRISNQRLNTYLKELAQLAGFTQTIEINEYRGGKHQKTSMEKWELISSHTARRSFATNAYKRGLPASEIMKFTGHTTMQSFMKYIKVTGEESAVVLSEHEFFTGKTKLKVVR